MDDDVLADHAWRILTRLAAENPTTARYTRWIKLNLEPDQTMVAINHTMFCHVLRTAMADLDELADWRQFLAHLDRKAAEQVMLNPDLAERSAEW